MARTVIFSLVAAVAVFTHSASVIAQDDPAQPPEKRDLQALLGDTSDFDGPLLTEEQTEIFTRYFPKTLTKLRQNEPVHVVVLGDSIANMLGYGKDKYDWLKSFHGVFVGELCKQFFYTGGVRLVKQRSGKPEKIDGSIGDEITLRNMARNGSTSLHIFQRLTTDAFFNKPDLVIINYGINDALAGVPLGTYREAISKAVDYTRKRGSEVILLGPAIILADSSKLRAMSITRPYSSVMREIAEEKKVFYADLGDISGLLGGISSDIPLEQVTQRVLNNLEKYFNHGPDVVDLIHPNADGHKNMGKHAFRGLIKPEPDDYAITESTVQNTGEGDLTLTFTLKNRASEEREVTLIPMPLAKAFETEEGPRRFTIPAGGAEKIELAYKSLAQGTHDGFRFDLPPGHEEFIRGSVVCVDEQQCGFVDFKAVITPVAFNWDFGAQFNLSGKFSAGGELVNTGDSPLAATVTAEWNGQRGQGKAMVPPGGRHPLKFQFQFPSDSENDFRNFSDIVVNVAVGDKEYRFKRGIEISRNFGLEQEISMIDLVRGGEGQPPADARKSVRFHARANKELLSLIFDMKGHTIAATPDQPVAIVADIALDARSWGKRQHFGFVDPLRITTGASDGSGTCGKIWPATFGNEYALELNEKLIKSHLSVMPGGIRRLTVGIPTSYLSLHEFALGNGNSQIGVDVILNIKEREGTGPPEFSNRYTLINNGMFRCDATSLAVLELTNSPTSRWSVRLF